MKNKTFVKSFGVAILLFAFTYCSDAPQGSLANQLSPSQKQKVKELSSHLLASMTEGGFFSKPVSDLSHVLGHPAMTNFTGRLDKDDSQRVDKILGHSLFRELSGNNPTFVRSKDDGVELSPAAQAVLTDLSSEINTYLDDYFNSADTLNFNGEQIAAELASLIENAEQRIALQSGFSEGEVTALLAAMQIQRDLIPSIVDNANTIFNSTPEGGRTKSFFKKLGRYVGSVVVSIAAGAVIGGVIGAIIAGAGGEDSKGTTAFAFLGATIGAGVGALIGTYQATQDRCATTWNFKTTFPLIDYVPC